MNPLIFHCDGKDASGGRRAGREAGSDRRIDGASADSG